MATRKLGKRMRLRWPHCLAALPAATVESAADAEAYAIAPSDMLMTGNAGILEGRIELCAPCIPSRPLLPNSRLELAKACPVDYCLLPPLER